MLDLLADGHKLVSIHAPVKGATQTLGRREIEFDVSIHAPVKGATDQVAHMPPHAAQFQSTLP